MIARAYDAMSLASKGPKKMKSKYNWRQRIEILQSLGEGTYGKVKLAVDKKTGKKMAVKYIMKKKIGNEQDLQRVRREIDIMASLRHEHIVQIYKVCENKEKIVIMMEYVDGGELYEYVSARGVLSDVDARRVFRQVVAAVHFMHQSGVVHRDLKLENILLDSSGSVKLADFGLSNRWQHNRFLHTFCGSPLYASPEIVNGRPYYGPEVDCWSLGVLLYTLVYGTMPFDGSNFERLRSQITRGDYYEPTKPSDAASLIRRLLTVNAAKRATVGDVCRHWWTNVDCTRSLWHEVQDVKVSSGEAAEKRTSDYFEDDSIFAESADSAPVDLSAGDEQTQQLQQTGPRLPTPAEAPPAEDQCGFRASSRCPPDWGPGRASIATEAGAAAAGCGDAIASLPREVAAKCSSGDSGCALADLNGCCTAEFRVTPSTEQLTASDAAAAGKAASSRYSMSDIEAVLDAVDGLLAVDRGSDSSSGPGNRTASRGLAACGATTAGDGGLADVVSSRRRSISVLPCSAPAFGRDASGATFSFELSSASCSSGGGSEAAAAAGTEPAAAQWAVPARGRSKSLKSAKLYRCGDVKPCGGGGGSCGDSVSSLSSDGNLLDFDSSDSSSDDPMAADNVFPVGVGRDQRPDAPQ